MNKSQKAQYARQYSRYIDKIERKYAPLFTSALNKQVNDIMAAVELHGVGNVLTNLHSFADNDLLRRVMYQLYVTEGVKRAKSYFDYLNKAYGQEYSKDFPRLKSWFDTLVAFFYTTGGNEITNITNTTLEWIRGKLSKGMEEGLTIPEIRDSLKSREINKARGNVIARTETVTVLNYASNKVAHELPISLVHVWSAINDKRTRKSHRHLNGQTKPLDEPFTNGGMYPGDPTLPAAERIQCRCVELHEPLRDSNGMLILK